MYTHRIHILTAVTWLVGAVMADASEPGIYHRYFTKGSIVEASDAGIYLCMGTTDGATAG